MIEILCNDCLDTGWVEDREGRSVCSCIAETEPYQQLQAEVERLRKSVEDWHDAAVRAERNAAMSQEETLSHIDRIAALMDEAERLREDHKYACDVADNLRAEIKTLRNQSVANAEDAERYRWLRDHASPEELSVVESWMYETGDELDAAIDAAREGE